MAAREVVHVLLVFLAFLAVVAAIVVWRDAPPRSIDTSTTIVGVSHSGLMTGTVRQLRANRTCGLTVAQQIVASSIDWSDRKLYFTTHHPEGIWEWDLRSGRVSRVDEREAGLLSANAGRIAVVADTRSGMCDLLVGRPGDLKSWTTLPCYSRVALGADRVWIEEQGAKLVEIRPDGTRTPAEYGTTAAFDSSGNRVAFLDSSNRLFVHDFTDGDTTSIAKNVRLYDRFFPTLAWNEDGSLTAATLAPALIVDDPFCRSLSSTRFPCPESDRYSLGEPGKRERIYSGIGAYFAWTANDRLPCPHL